MSEGVTSRYEKRENADKKEIETLHNESSQVSKLLGAKDLFMFGLPDNRFDTVPLLDIIKIIEELIQKLSPSVIFTHYISDLNIDHTILSRAVITATRPTIKDYCVKEIYSFEVPSSTEWSFGQINQLFNPNYFINIESTIDTKIEAMEIYENEKRLYPHPRSPEGLTAIARKWGTTVGVDYAEAFSLVRKLL